MHQNIVDMDVVAILMEIHFCNTANVCTTLTIVGNLFVVELHDIIQYASGHRIMTTPHQIIDMLCINHLLRK